MFLAQKICWKGYIKPTKKTTYVFGTENMLKGYIKPTKKTTYVFITVEHDLSSHIQRKIIKII